MCEQLNNICIHIYICICVEGPEWPLIFAQIMCAKVIWHTNFALFLFYLFICGFWGFCVLCVRSVKEISVNMIICPWGGICIIYSNCHFLSATICALDNQKFCVSSSHGVFVGSILELIRNMQTHFWIDGELSIEIIFHKFQIEATWKQTKENRKWAKSQ